MDITKVTTERDDIAVVLPPDDDLQKAPQRATRGRHAEQYPSGLSRATDDQSKSYRSFWGRTQAFLLASAFSAPSDRSDTTTKEG